MSRAAIAWARTVCDLTIPAKSVLNVLADHANAAGCCFPSEARIGRIACMSSRHVRRQIHVLEKKGLVKRLPRFSDGSGGQTSNLYQLVVGSNEVGPPGVDSVVRPRGQLGPAKDTHLKSVCSDEQKASVNQIGRETAIEAREVFDKAFERWKAKCPARLSRPRAWPLWVAACERQTPAKLLAAAERYLDEDPDIRRLGTPKSFHAWLTDENYEAWIPGEAVENRIEASGSIPAKLREKLVRLNGEAWVSSWVDVCGWDEERQALVARTAFRRDRLLRELRPHLAQLRLTVT